MPDYDYYALQIPNLCVGIPKLCVGILVCSIMCLLKSIITLALQRTCARPGARSKDGIRREGGSGYEDGTETPAGNVTWQDGDLFSNPLCKVTVIGNLL